MRKKGFYVTCVDQSLEMCKRCMDKGFLTVQAPLQDLTAFTDETFDGAWASASLLHVPKKDLPDTLAGIERILAPNGTLQLLVKQGDGERWIPMPDDPTYKRFFSFFQPQELEQFLSPLNYERLVDMKVSNRAEPGETVWLNYLCTKR